MELHFFQNQFHSLLDSIPEKIKGIKLNSGLPLKKSVKNKIETALGKQLPIEFEYFYENLGELQFRFKDQVNAKIVNAEQMMGKKYTPLAVIDDDFIKKNYKKNPFWQTFFFDLHIDNFSWDDLKSVEKLETLRRQKLILEHCAGLAYVTVDFFVENKEYQLNHFYRGDLNPINLTFSEFIEKFMYLGDSLFWWEHYMNSDYLKFNSAFPWLEIENEIVGFKKEYFNK